MNRICKKIKMTIIIFMIFTFSIDNIAAVVSDNDGSAFVTKAEFEALKENFSSQIHDYNDSIDKKIDGAIANYLAGIKIEETISIEPEVTNYKLIRWMHGPYMYFTNRRFTEYTTTAGRYVDSTGWKIINPENRRQTSSDGYLWWHDYVYGGYSMFNISFLMHPYNVPWAWGTGRNVTTSRGPSIYAAMEKEDSNFVVYAKDGGFQAERGFQCYLWTRSHSGTFKDDDAEILGGVGRSTYLQPNTSNASLTLTSNTLGDKELANYTINNINYTNGTTVYTDFTIQSVVRQDYNPSLITTDPFTGLWINGTDGVALKVACGYKDYMGEHYSRVGNSLVEDNRWSTERQFKGDMNNFIYGMWGADVTGEMNVAPPLIVSDFTYLDLSESPNVVTVPFKIALLGIGVQNPYVGHTDWRYGHYQGYKGSNDMGSMSFSFPLFYRVKWADMYSGEFKNNNKPICKSAGLPLIENSEQAGEVKLKIKYEEKSDNDTGVVTLTPDHKIKTYFKNKPFTDNTGTYYKGYKNINGTGTAVELNGTEWTSKEITLNIPIEKNDSIYMRIDPLTTNGIYCIITDYSCEFVTD